MWVLESCLEQVNVESGEDLGNLMNWIDRVSPQCIGACDFLPKNIPLSSSVEISKSILLER